MLILPLPSAPDWRHPPWVTLCIIAICSFIYFGLQLRTEKFSNEAYEVYIGAELDKLEVPRYLDYLRQTGKLKEAAQLEAEKGPASAFLALQSLQFNPGFMQKLHRDEIIRPDEPAYPRWKKTRASFEELLNKSFTERFILRPAHPTWASLLLHMFMHGDVMHLLGNMAVFFVVGYTVESALGGWRYLAFYLLSGLGATATDLIFPSDFGGSLGASGAIAGVMAMFVVIYGLRKIRFFYSLLFYMGTMQASALLILPIWLANEVLQKILNHGSNINYLAHFCGLLTGAFLTMLYRWRRGWQTAEHVIRQEDDLATQKLVQQAEKLLAQLRFEPAAKVLAVLIERKPQDRKLAEDFYQAAKMQSDLALRQAAGRHVLTHAASADGGILPLAAEAWQQLEKQQAAPPKLATSDWLRLVAAWTDTGFLAQAEQLLMLLVHKAGPHAALPAQLYRLGLAFQRKQQEERAISCWRILVQYYPQSAEAKLIQLKR